MVIVWNLQITFDRRIAFPGEQVHAQFTIENPTPFPIYIAECTWNTSFFAASEHAVLFYAGLQVAPHTTQALGSGKITIPEVPDGAYQLDAILRTYMWDNQKSRWNDLGLVPLTQPQQIMVAHLPRYRAFVSRSNRPEDAPLVDFATHTIQEWGFDTHTVGINEFVKHSQNISERIAEEIIKADCLAAIATPRDQGETLNLHKTLIWLQNEIGMALAVGKPFLVFADTSVHLEGLLDDPGVPVLRYSPQDLLTLQSTIDKAMPIVRQSIKTRQEIALVQLLKDRDRAIVYGAFVAGTVSSLPS